MKRLSGGGLVLHPVKDQGGQKRVRMENDLVGVDVCPEAARVLNITNRKARTGYLIHLESKLPDNAQAGGIGDCRYNADWRAGKWEYMERDERLGGYSHEAGKGAGSVWVRMWKDALHDQWRDALYPGLKVERTVRVCRGSPAVEILDVRTNPESNRRHMIYDLLFCLVPQGGGQLEGALRLPVWARVQVLYSDRRVEVLGREDYASREERRDNVRAVLLTEPDAGEGVLVEFDRPQQIELRTSPGGGWEGNLFLSVRHPFRLERYETLKRRFAITPYSLDRARIDALFAGAVTEDAESTAIRDDLEAALADTLGLTRDAMTRGMLQGLARMGRHALGIGGGSNRRWARESAEELTRLAGQLAAGKEIHHPFFDKAFLADKRRLLKKFPYKRNRAGLGKVETQLSAASRADSCYTPDALMSQAVEAVCFADRPSLKRIGRIYKEGFFDQLLFRRCEVESQTISNANWCVSLLLINEALGAAGVFGEEELAVTNEILWLQGRLVDEYGCGAHGNWGTMERTFLAYLGTVFVGAGRRPVWMEKAVECLDVTILGPCSPDGGWPEPPGYTHWGMLKGLELMEVLGRSGFLGGRTAEYDRKLCRMMEYQWRLMTADDLLPPIGDGWYVFRADIYMPFARRYQRKDWAAACLRRKWTAAGRDLLFSGPVPAVGRDWRTPAKRQTDLLRHDGYALFRQGDVQLTLFFGYQAGHGHFDTLSFLLKAHGKDFVAEHVASAKVLGCGYGSRFNQEWTRASRSHAMVLVDNRTYTEQKPGVCLKWERRAPGRAYGVFQAPAYPGVTVTREVRQDARTFLLTDTIEGGANTALSEADKARLADAKVDAGPGAGAFHTWRALFPGTARISRTGGRVTVNVEGASIGVDLSGLDPDCEVLLDSAPPRDFADTEKIARRGKMLVIRKRIGPEQRTVFKVKIEV